MEAIHGMTNGSQYRAEVVAWRVVPLLLWWVGMNTCKCKPQIVNEHTLLGSFIHVQRLKCTCVHAYSSVSITKSQATNIMHTREIQLAWISAIQTGWDTILVWDFFLLHTVLPSCAHIKEAFSFEQKDLNTYLKYRDAAFKLWARSLFKNTAPL